MQADHGFGNSSLERSPKSIKPAQPHDDAFCLTSPKSARDAHTLGGLTNDPSVCNLTASVYSPSTQDSPLVVGGTGVTWTDQVYSPLPQLALREVTSPRAHMALNHQHQDSIEQGPQTSRIKQTARKYLSRSSVRDRHKRVSHFLHRAKSVMLDSFKDEDPDGLTLTTQKSFQRIRQVWVDVDLAPHQLQYYALLLLDFKKQLDGTKPRRLNVVKMVAYLRVAANAVELLPDTILAQLALDNRVDIQSLNETFTEMLNFSAETIAANLQSSRWRRKGVTPLLHGSSENTQDSDSDQSYQAHSIVCDICRDIRADTRLLPCEHPFHHGCLMEFWADEQRRGLCPCCDSPVDSMQGASLLDMAVKAVGSGYEPKLNKNRKWVLSNKFQKILECLEFELAKAAKEKTVARFVVVADFKAMVEGFSRTLATFGKIHYDVITSGLSKLKVPSALVKFGASLEPRLLLYHSSAISAKHDLSSTTHVYFMTPWRDQEVRRTVLNCVLQNMIAGQTILVADFVATDSIEAEALQINSSDSTEEDSYGGNSYVDSSWAQNA